MIYQPEDLIENNGSYTTPNGERVSSKERRIQVFGDFKIGAYGESESKCECAVNVKCDAIIPAFSDDYFKFDRKFKIDVVYTGAIPEPHARGLNTVALALSSQPLRKELEKIVTEKCDAIEDIQSTGSFAPIVGTLTDALSDALKEFYASMYSSYVENREEYEQKIADILDVGVNWLKFEAIHTQAAVGSEFIDLDGNKQHGWATYPPCDMVMVYKRYSAKRVIGGFVHDQRIKARRAREAKAEARWQEKYGANR